MSEKLEFGEENNIIVLRRAWELSLHLLATKVSVVTFDSWIRPTQPIEYKENIVTLGVSSAFARERLEKVSNAIRSALEFHLDTTGLQIHIVIMAKEASENTSSNKRNSQKDSSLQTALALDNEPSEENNCAEQVGLFANQKSWSSITPKESPSTLKPATPSNTLPRPKTPVRKPEPKKRATSEIEIPSLPLNDRYIFENFLVGRSNRLAHAGALQVAANPGNVYNPLFLYGLPGLGKTHLLHAIAHAIRKTRPNDRVAYVSGEYFAQHYISALREHATEDFRRQYREVDVWLVDDIQFIASKEHTKEEFFHTFNTLYQTGKQIVIASDRSPRELNTMDERLRSRFQSGLIADIGAPELETRIAILQKCRLRENISIPDDVLEYIANAIQSKIRALEGALTKLIAYSSIMNVPISPRLAQNALSEYYIEKPVHTRVLTVDEILEVVSKEFGTTAAVLKGTSRNKEISLARHIAMYLCREMLPETNMRVIGGQLGGRDHSTIIHACQKIQLLLEVDTDLKSSTNRLRHLLTRE